MSPETRRQAKNAPKKRGAMQTGQSGTTSSPLTSNPPLANSNGRTGAHVTCKSETDSRKANF